MDKSCGLVTVVRHYKLFLFLLLNCCRCVNPRKEGFHSGFASVTILSLFYWFWRHEDCAGKFEEMVTSPFQQQKWIKTFEPQEPNLSHSAKVFKDKMPHGSHKTWRPVFCYPSYFKLFDYARGKCTCLLLQIWHFDTSPLISKWIWNFWIQVELTPFSTFLWWVVSINHSILKNQVEMTPLSTFAKGDNSWKPPVGRPGAFNIVHIFYSCLEN